MSDELTQSGGRLLPKLPGDVAIRLGTVALEQVNDHHLRLLVARAAGQDPDAWEELYRRSYRRLFGFARRRLPDDLAAEDAVSETMTRALDSIGRFTWQGGGFDAWLYGILRNVVHEAGRRANGTGTSDHRTGRPRDPGPEEHAIADEQRDAMRDAFDRLGADDREVLELRIHGGLSSEEVGRLLGKQPGTVRMAQARALDRLRTIMEEVSRDLMRSSSVRSPDPSPPTHPRTRPPSVSRSSAPRSRPASGAAHDPGAAHHQPDVARRRRRRRCRRTRRGCGVRVGAHAPRQRRPGRRRGRVRRPDGRPGRPHGGRRARGRSPPGSAASSSSTPMRSRSCRPERSTRSGSSRRTMRPAPPCASRPARSTPIPTGAATSSSTAAVDPRATRSSR